MGPDENVAVCSRCGGEREHATIRVPIGCHVYRVRLDVDGAPAVRVRSLDVLGSSALSPAIWRGRIAFARLREQEDRQRA